MSEEIIKCRAAVEISPIASNEILFLPIGLHAITPVSGGIGRPIKVKVTPESAHAVQEQHTLLMAKGKRPYFDFNHEDGPASFWPEQFIWRNGEGVIARGEWTSRGRKSVEGKDYRAFSPVFHVDNKRAEAALVVCKENADPNMGGLVNNPAFKDLPLWAKNGEIPDAGATGENAEGNKMTNEEIAALRAKNEELEQTVAALKASNENDEKLTAAEAELKAGRLQIEAEQLRAENARQSSVIQARNKTEAESAVKAAIKRNAILPKDTKTQNELIARATADPSFVSVINAMQGGNTSLSTRIAAGFQTSGVEITAEAPSAIFAALARTNTDQRNARKMSDKVAVSRKFAAIYASELSLAASQDNPGQYRRLMAMPMEELEALVAADVTDGDLGTLSGTLVVQRTLELLKFSFPSLAMFTTDFTAEQASFNQTIMTRTVDIPNVVTYNTSTGWADSTATTNDVPITIDKHRGVPITFNEQIMASTARRLFDEQAPAQAYALAKDMVDDLYSNITDANFPNNTVVATLSFNRSSVIDIGVALDLQGVPPITRTMILYPTVFGNLEKDSTFVSPLLYTKPELVTNPAPDGVKLVMDVESFQVVKAPNLPTNDANLTGFAGSRSALLIATRLPNDYTKFAPGVSFGNVQTVTDPDLGISVMLVQYVNHTLATGTQRISLMYGTAAGQSNAGHLIKAATGSGSSRTS